MGNWIKMTEVLEDRQIDDWKLERFTIGDNDFYAMRQGIASGTYMRLIHAGECVMSDTYMERRTNTDFCINAHGDVLIGGLGLGMILLAIQDKPEVKSITVLEKNQEVIDMVGSQLPLNEKVRVVHADVFEWKPEKGVKYDVSYMNIWNYVNKDVYKNEMQPLKRRYARFLKSKQENPNRYNKCWAELEARTGKRLI